MKVEDYARQIEASKNADTSGRLRTYLEDNDPTGYIDPLDAIFGGDTSYNLNRD